MLHIFSRNKTFINLNRKKMIKVYSNHSIWYLHEFKIVTLCWLLFSLDGCNWTFDDRKIHVLFWHISYESQRQSSRECSRHLTIIVSSTLPNVLQSYCLLMRILKFTSDRTWRDEKTDLHVLQRCCKFVVNFVFAQLIPYLHRSKFMDLV